MVRIGGSHPPDPGSIPGRGKQSTFALPVQKTFGRCDGTLFGRVGSCVSTFKMPNRVPTNAYSFILRRDQEAGGIKKLKLIN